MSVMFSNPSASLYIIPRTVILAIHIYSCMDGFWYGYYTAGWLYLVALFLFLSNTRQPVPISYSLRLQLYVFGAEVYIQQ